VQSRRLHPHRHNWGYHSYVPRRLLAAHQSNCKPGSEAGGMNNAVQLIKLAQKLAIARGEPHIVVQVASGQIVVMRDGKLRGAILLERCLP